MGRASRMKAQRRAERGTAEFGVFCPGVLEVLSIGKGDTKIVIGGPDDVDRARRIVEEMLRAGYSIFVETDRGPVKVKRFNPRRMVYVIADVPEPTAEAPRPARGRKATEKAAEREVPVAGSRATAVGRTAGG